MAEYEIISGCNEFELASNVKRKLIMGWKCKGGVSVVHAEFPPVIDQLSNEINQKEGITLFYQAMVR